MSDFFLQKPECVKIFPDNKNADFFLSVTGYNNFHHIKPHPYLRLQTQHTLHFVISGKGYLTVNGETREVKKYDLFYLDNTRAFAYVPDSGYPWEYVWFEIVGNDAGRYFGEAGFTPDNNIIKSNNGDKLHAELKTAYEKLARGENVSYFSILSLFFLALDSACSPKLPSGFFNEKSFIDEVKTHIALKCPAPDFSIENLCRNLGVSHSHLCRVFKESEGVSVVNYIKEQKLLKAKGLLSATDLTLYEIAENCGFNEYEYFLKSFKKHFGISPTEYRKNL